MRWPKVSSWQQIARQPMLREGVFAAASLYLFVRAMMGFTFLNVLFFVPVTLWVFYHLPRLRLHFASTAEAVWFAVLAVYLAFALWGNYFLLVAGGLTLELIPCLVWAACLAAVVLRRMDDWADRPRTASARYMAGKWALLVALILLPLLLYREAVYPAVMTADSNTHLAQAIDAAPLSDWHSPLYTLCMRGLLAICPQVSVISLAQSLLAAAVLAACGMLLHRHGLSYRAVCAGAMVFALLPNNGLIINTIWKDVPFTLLLLLLTYAALRLLEQLDGATARRARLWPICLVIGGSMAGVCLFRQNGIAAVVGAGVLLVYFGVRYRRWVLPGTLAAVLLVVAVVQGPVYNRLLGVAHEEKSDDAKYYSLLHDLQGAYYAGANFSAEDAQLLGRMIPDIEMNWDTYDDFDVADAFYEVYDMQEVHFGSFVRLYLTTLAKSPLWTLRGMATRMSHFWSILLRNEHYINTTGTMTTDVWADMYFPEEIEHYGMRRPPTSVFGGTVQALRDASKQPVATAIFWSLGLWTAWLLFSVFYCALRKKGRLLWALAPALGNLLGLMATCSWSDYRYGYFLFLIGAFFPVYALLYTSKPTTDGGQ